jgi:hypothetical protein
VKRAAAITFAAGVMWMLTAGTVSAAPVVLEPESQVSGISPFLSCNLDGVGLPGSHAFLNSEVEPWVTVNPADPLNIVATWQADRWSNGGARGLAVGVSFNGGIDWEEVVIPGLTRCATGTYQRASDPWVSFSPNGDLHTIALVFDRGFFALNSMVTSKSTDGGLTWSRQIPLAGNFSPKFNDKESITADPTDSNFVYAVWDRINTALGGGPTLFARSVDGGTSWERTRTIYDPGTRAQTIGNQVVVQPDGTLQAFFTEINAPDIFTFTISIASKRSHDKGATWLPPGPALRHHEISPRAVIEPDRSEAVRDASFLFDVAVDRSNGNLYLAWQDSAPNNFRYSQIVFSMSTDGGLTFSAPVVVNQTPPVTNFKLNQAFLPSIHVTGAGVVGVSYYDFRFNGLEPESLTDFWLVLCDPAKSDCATSAGWAEEVRVTDASFDYSKAPFAGGLFLGDYMGLAAAGNDFISVYSKPHGSDPASIFSRKIIIPLEDVIDPRGLGWWRKQVRVANGGRGKSEESASDLLGSLGSIHKSHDLFDAIADLSSLEVALDPSMAGDHAGRARVHFLALLLNMASGHLTSFSELASGETVEAAAREILAVILDPAGSKSDLNDAKDLAAGINEGELFGE